MQIEIKNVSKIYPNGKKALSGVSAEIESPNLIGLLGPNGSGKTTLMKLLVAALLPTEGEIIVNGKSLKAQEKALKNQLGYLPQAFGLYEELTVVQFLDYISALKGIENKKRAIDTVIDKTNLDEKRKARIGTLSGGQRQRVGVAQALLGSPELMIFDEPTIGLDPEERIGFRNLFSQTAQEKIVLLSTHIIEDVQSICNRLLVISEGEIQFDGTPEQLILKAQGHVGVIHGEHHGHFNYRDCIVTSRINTALGVSSRVVAQELPPISEPSEPTLEDAYIYLLSCHDKGMG